MIKFSNTIAFWVTHPIAKHSGFLIFFSISYCIAKQCGETTTIENIITQHQTGAIITDEFFTDDESLCETIRARLLSILKMNAIVRTITKQTFEARQVVGRGDDEDIAYASLHQHADRVIDHRFVVDRQELF